MSGACRSLRDNPIPYATMPLGDALAWQAKRNPAAPAVTLGEGTVTRMQLEEAANGAADALARLGVGKDDFVTMCMATGPLHHTVAFGLWKLGATPAPVSNRLPPAELEAIVATISPRLIVADGDLDVAGVAVVRPERLIGDPKPWPGKVATYIKATTSGGSTGRPKVIVDHTPGQIDPSAPWLGLAVDDVVLHPAPLYHNAPFLHTNMALCFGAHVIEMSRFDPLEWLQLVERHRARWAYLVPTMMARIWSLPAEVRHRFDLSSLEVVVHMASVCPAWLKAAWIEWLGADLIWDVYAGTEGLGATAISGREWLDHRGSVGRLWIGRDLQIVDDHGKALPPGEVGEIRFTPPRDELAFHYLGSETPELDKANYGDLGWLDPDGYLYIADRRTDMVVVGGSNVYPAEVEAALDAHPAIASSLVVGLPDDDLGQVLHAVVHLEVNVAPPPPAELKRHLDRWLARNKHPRTFDISDAPLRDDAGKARRTLVRDERIRRRSEGERFVAIGQ